MESKEPQVKKERKILLLEGVVVWFIFQISFYWDFPLVHNKFKLLDICSNQSFVGVNQLIAIKVITLIILLRKLQDFFRQKYLEKMYGKKHITEYMMSLCYLGVVACTCNPVTL